MAKLTRDIWFSYIRQRNIPLDKSSIYTALTDAETYALSGGTSYVGQIVSVIDEEASSVTVYKIGTDKTLQPIIETGLSVNDVIDILQQNGYITSDDTLELISDEIEKIEGKIPTKVSQLENDKGYLTEHQDLSDYAKKSDIPSLDGYATKEELSTVSGITNNLFTSITSNIEEIHQSINELVSNDKTLNDDINKLSGDTAEAINSIRETIDTLSSDTKDSFTKIHKSINDLSGDTVSALTEVRQYIDGKISAIPAQVSYKGDNKTISAKTDSDSSVIFSVIESALTIETKQVSGLSAEFSNLETRINDKISNAVSSVYKVRGSKDTFEDLPKEKNEIGDVYNVISSVTISNDFYPAGTNFVWTEKGWDALGGTIDLSHYVTEEAIESAITSIKEDITNTNEEIQGLSDDISAFKENVEQIKQGIEKSISDIDKRISGNTDDIEELSGITSSNSDSIRDLSLSAETFSSSINTINTNIQNINAHISELSGNTGQLQSQIDELSENLDSTNSALTDAVSEIENVKEIVKTMMDVDASIIQDINKVSGITSEHSEKIKHIENELVSDFSVTKIFDEDNSGFTEFNIEKEGNDVSIGLNGFDGGIIFIE